VLSALLSLAFIAAVPLVPAAAAISDVTIGLEFLRTRLIGAGS
jgi:hypothetical protein